MPKFRISGSPAVTFDSQPKLAGVKKIFSDRYVVAICLAWLVPLVFSVIYILVNIGKLPFEIPLFYSRVWGEEQLASREYIYLPVIAVFLFGIINFIITLFIKKEDKLFSYLLLATAAGISVLSAITVFNIINLVV